MIKAKGKVQKTINFNAGEFFEISKLYNQLVSNDTIRGMTQHKFMRLLIQEGLKNYKKALRINRKGDKLR